MVIYGSILKIEAASTESWQFAWHFFTSIDIKPGCQNIAKLIIVSGYANSNIMFVCHVSQVDLFMFLWYFTTLPYLHDVKVL